jgi:hypothetical protein
LESQAENELDEQKANEMEIEGERLSEYADFFKAVFYLSVQHELGCWGKQIGVRKDWKIVEVPDRPGPAELIMKRFSGTP